MKKKKIFIGIIIVLFGVLAFAYRYFSTANAEKFIAEYQRYEAVSRAHELAAFAPGARGNAARREANGILSRVLTEEMKPKERLDLSIAGLAPLNTLRNEIDAMKADGKKTEANVSALHAAALEMEGIRMRRRAENIAAIAEERMEALNEIRDILYRMNDATGDIFLGIIREDGVLSGKRIIELNDAIPAAEKDFDRLTALYAKLDIIEKRIDAAEYDFECSAHVPCSKSL